MRQVLVIGLFVLSTVGIAAELTLSPSERLITILGTNDIHGGVEPTLNKDKKPQGGLALWAGVARALRQGIAQKYPKQAGVLTVDAGDQFQGTLLSNYDEGELVFRAMNLVGYDAVVPGNHDYDFGPSGWLIDQSEDESRKREAFEKIINLARFSLISANTFYHASLVDMKGEQVEVERRGCKTDKIIDWTKAKRPGFLVPYVIKRVAGVRVALIGLDLPSTPETTTPANVVDLCFGAEIEHYRRTRALLQGKADVFVIVIHNGNATGKDVSRIVETLTKPEKLVDVVITGHTHFTYNERVNGVPVIQSGSGGIAFGRVDVVWDTAQRKLVDEKTRAAAGVRMSATECDQAAKAFSTTFCEAKADGTGVSYEGVPAVELPSVLDLVKTAREKIAGIAGRKLGSSEKELTRDRIKESPLSNAMTDVFRDASGADMATINTGGLRATLPKGEFTYEDLFKVIPFSNRGLVVGPMSADRVVSLLQRSIRTCGSYGALMQSGLRVVFRRDCSHAGGSVDQNAKLLRAETLKGEVIFDENGIPPTAPQELKVATLDFLAAGGDGIEGFKGVPVIWDMGILREILTEQFMKEPASFVGDIDHRWKNELPE